MSKKENANQKLNKWMNCAYIETEEKKPFFEGYRPLYYFRNTTEEENEAERKALERLSKPTGINLFEDNITCTSASSKPITLDDLDKLAEKLNQLPPVPIEIEISQLAWNVLSSQLNIHMVHNSSKISTLFGIRIVSYEGNEIKFNQMRVNYNNGTSKVIDVFEYDCNYACIYKNIFEDDK